MAYVKNNWVDREGTTRYFETVDSDGAKIFTPDYTQVTEMGTPVNADNMNHIEEGIEAGSFTKYNSMTTYSKDDLVTAIVENELKVYKSLQDNNNGFNLTDSTYWEEVEFAGGIDTETLDQFVLKDSLHEVQVIIETYVNGTSWYRIWSDGWCEQGGSYTTSGTYTFLKPFKDTNYCLTTGSFSSEDQAVTYVRDALYNRTATGFTTLVGAKQTWYACGYIW